MTNLPDVIVCVPTYKRKWPAILSLIRYTPNVTFTLCVRKEDYDAGYYDDAQFNLPNIEYMLLTNVKCIGTTREFIVQESIRRGYKYCMMIDDTQYGIHDIHNRMHTFSGILRNCVNRLETDVLRDKAFGLNFTRKTFKQKFSSEETYFVSQLCQTYILNLDVIKKYDLHFGAMDTVGVEDLIFYYEACRKNLVCLNNTRFIRIGQMPSVKKEGGCHYGNERKCEQDVQNERFAILEQYVKTMNYTEPYLKRVDSILYPGTFYYKLDTKTAKKMIVDDIYCLHSK